MSSSDARVAANLGTIRTSGIFLGKHLNVARKPYTTARRRQAKNGYAVSVFA